MVIVGNNISTKNTKNFIKKGIKYSAFIALGAFITFQLTHGEGKEAVTELIQQSKSDSNKIAVKLTGSNIEENSEKITSSIKSNVISGTNEVKRVFNETNQEIKDGTFVDNVNNNLKGKIRQIRQYSGDLAERLSQKMKP